MTKPSNKGVKLTPPPSAVLRFPAAAQAWRQEPCCGSDGVFVQRRFNDSDWRGELLKDDRWACGTRPAGNAAFNVFNPRVGALA